MSALADRSCCLWLSLMVCLAGCAQLTVADLPLAGARLARVRGQLQTRDLGWLELLYGAGADRALRLFDRTLAEGADPWTLLGRAMILQGQGREGQEARAWADLLRGCASSRGAGWQRACPGLGRLALGRLEALGAWRQPGLEPLLRRLVDGPALDPAGRDAALGLLVGLARRGGDAARVEQLTRQRGCPSSWRVVGPVWRNAHVDLLRKVPAAPSRDLRAEGCQLELRADRKWGGVYWIETDLSTSAGQQEVALTIDTASPWQLVLDGHTLWTHGLSAERPARQVALGLSLAPGRHRLGLKVGATDRYAGVTVRVAPARAGGPAIRFAPARGAAPAHVQGRPRASRIDCGALPAGDEKPVWYAPLWSFLAASEAAACGDLDRAYRLLAEARGRAPRFAPPTILTARLVLDDPTLPGAVAFDQAVRLLRDLIREDPSLGEAQLVLATLLLEREQPEPALRLFRLGRDAWPEVARWHEGLHKAYRERSYATEEERALERAVELDPSRCDLMDQLAALKRLRRDALGSLLMVQRTVSCDASSDAHARWLRDAGRLSDAVEEYRRVLRLRPGAAHLRRDLVRALQQLGRTEQARAELDRLLVDDPGSVDDLIELADLFGAAGGRDRAVQALRRAHARMPWQAELRRALERLDRRSVMERYRADGRAVIARYRRRRDRFGQDAPAVVVQDRMVTRLFADGSAVSLTHNIVQVLTKQGMERWGELALPSGAEVLTLRGVKADGSVAEPEEFLGEKRTVSVPGLEVGDFVEMEYLEASPAPVAFDGAVAPRFYFASFDAPLVVSEYLVVAPRSLRLQLDARGGAPRPRRSYARDRVELRFVANNQPRVVAEPAAVPADEYLPSVRLLSGASWERWRDRFLERATPYLQSTWLTRQIGRRIAAKHDSPRARARAVYDWILREIDDGGPALGSAASAVAGGRGSREMALVSLLRLAGIPAELWLVRPRTARGRAPEVERFKHALVHCPLPGGPVFLQPRTRHVPFGYVTPALRNGQALRLARGQALVRVPAAIPEAEDWRELRLRVETRANGTALVEATERQQGLLAQEWRRLFAKSGGPEGPEAAKLFEQQLGAAFPGASLRGLRVLNGNQPERPLELRYTFRLKNLCHHDQGNLLCRAGFHGPELQRHYVKLARRSQAMQLGFHVPTTVELDLAPPPGYGLARPPATVHLITDHGSFRRDVRQGEGGRVRLTTRFQLAFGRVPPARYPSFVRFARSVDRHFKLELVFSKTTDAQPGSSGSPHQSMSPVRSSMTSPSPACCACNAATGSAGSFGGT